MSPKGKELIRAMPSITVDRHLIQLDRHSGGFRETLSDEMAWLSLAGSRDPEGDRATKVDKEKIVGRSGRDKQF